MPAHTMRTAYATRATATQRDPLAKAGEILVRRIVHSLFPFARMEGVALPCVEKTFL